MPPSHFSIVIVQRGTIIHWGVVGMVAPEAMLPMPMPMFIPIAPRSIIIVVIVVVPRWKPRPGLDSGRPRPAASLGNL
jgi:hypothetical protein